jgi:hypothetical protein
VTEGNPEQPPATRTQSRGEASSEMDRVRLAAARDTPVSRAAATRQLLKVGARCGNSARRDLCGGCPERGIPSAPESVLGQGSGSLPQVCALRPVTEGNCTPCEGRWEATGGEPSVRRRTNAIRPGVTASLLGNGEAQTVREAMEAQRAEG